MTSNRILIIKTQLKIMSDDPLTSNTYEATYPFDFVTIFIKFLPYIEHE